jgi:hypothetical protein
VGHLNVKQYYVGLAIVQNCQCFVAIMCHTRYLEVRLPVDNFFQRKENQRIIVDNQDANWG